MTRFLSVLLCCLLAVISVQAQETKNLSRYKVFGVPDEVIKTITETPTSEDFQINENLPDCNNSEVIKYIKDNLLEDNQSQGRSVIDYRRRILSSRYVENFSEVDINTFKPSHNYSLAEAMINLKHQNNLAKQDMRVCVAKNQYAKKDIYILMYYHNHQVNIKVIGNKISKDIVFLPQKTQK